MLWNNVYEFYIIYIFGGRLSANQVYNGVIGQYYESGSGWVDTTTAQSVLFGVRGYPLGNYLSLIATVITMVAILLFCVFIIKKIIGIIFRLFTGSSAF